MSDKPIPFKPEMVRALLAGTKTQTRRAIKRQPYGRYIPLISFNHGRMEIAFGPDMKAKDGGPLWWRPLAQPGDLLWVREHWHSDVRNDALPPRDIPATDPVWYIADNGTLNVTEFSLRSSRFRPSMFMPRGASRITLTVTDVRVERLQDISEADAVAEGVVPVPYREGVAVRYSGIGAKFGLAQHTATGAFLHLWDSINGEDASAINPWVAAYTFAVGLHNIDAPNVRQIGDE